MPIQTICLILSALAVVAVVLTRVRFTRAAARNQQLGGSLLHVHTGFGLVGVVLWVIFLVADGGQTWASLVGIVGLGCLWATALVGLIFLARWLPSSGRRAAVAHDSWSQGPGLSILAHGGMFLGVVFFTYAYLMSKV